MNLSILIADSKTEQNKNYNLLKGVPNDIFNIDFCDKIEMAYIKYSEQQHDLVIINIDNQVEEAIDFIEKKKIDNTRVIILSSDEKYAFEFYKHNIIQFLIMPTGTGALLIAILKAMHTIKRFKKNTRNNVFLENRFQDFITITSTKKIELIKINNILYFEADGRYTIVHLTNGTCKIATRNLGEFQKLVDPKTFCRIHHKYVINLNRLLNINKSDGQYCEMENGKLIPVSKRKLEDLNKMLNINI